jgi:hypothetical protein
MMNNTVKAWGGRSLKRLLAAVLLLAGTQLPALANRAVPLAWDASSDTNVTGYVIHYGTQSGVYTNHLNVGNVTNASITLPADGGRYYISATSYDADGNQSDFSNETVITTPLATTTTPADILTGAGFVNGHFGFTVSGTPGARYAIQISTNLVNWISVQTNTSPFVYTDAGSGVDAKRFYRPVAL